MITYSRQNWQASLKCPTCRQSVNLLLTDYSSEESNSAIGQDYQSKINAYNKVHSGAPRSVSCCFLRGKAEEELFFFKEYSFTFYFFFYFFFMKQIGEIISDAPMLLRRLAHDMIYGTGLVLVLKLRILLYILFAVVYLLSPFDVIPEAIFGIIGILDDIAVVLILALYLSTIYRAARIG